MIEAVLLEICSLQYACQATKRTPGKLRNNYYWR